MASAALRLLGASFSLLSALQVHATCGPDALGTARTLTLKRAAAAWGMDQHAGLPLEAGEVVLTFDDGPRAETTPQVLKALADQCVKATFFLIGTNLAKNPDLARREISAGHSLGIHSNTHAHLAKLTESDQLTDLKRNVDTYQAVFGTAPAAYRFPFLEETPVLLAELARRKMTVMSIDISIDDWLEGSTADLLVLRMLDRLKVAGRGIILMHDAFVPTAKALPALLKALKEHGYRVVHLEWEPA